MRFPYFFLHNIPKHRLVPGVFAIDGYGVLRGMMSENRKITKNAGWFFPVYLIVVVGILLWNVTHSAEMTWEYRELLCAEREDGAGDARFELRDETPLTLRTLPEENGEIGQKAKFCGIRLLCYDNENSLRFYGETVCAEVRSGETGEILGSARMPLRNQTPYPQDETKMYIPFPEALEGISREPLEVRVSSEGLVRNGISFTAAGQEEDGSLLLAMAVYEKKTIRLFESLVYFLAELGLGFFCLYLYNRKKIPLFPRRDAASSRRDGDDGASGAGPDGFRKRRGGNGFRGRELTVPAVLLFSFLLLAAYTYFTAIAPTADASCAEYLVSGAIRRDRLAVSRGDVVRQVILPRQDNLSGIGIRLRDRNGESSGADAAGDAALSWRVLDAAQNELAGGGGRIRDLAAVNSVLTEASAEKEVLDAAPNYILLPLGRAVERAAGRALILELRVEETGGGEEDSLFLQTSAGGNGQVLVNGEETGAELCLLGVYRNNGFLRGLFRGMSLAAAAFLILLYLAARHLRRSGTESPGPEEARSERRRTARMYLLCALAMGLIFSFMTPAYTVPDERTHIETIYALSNRFLGIWNPGGPDRLKKRACDVDASILNTMPMSLESYRRQTELFGAADPGADAADAAAVPAENRTDSAAGDENGGAAAGDAMVSVYGRDALGNVTALCYLPSTIGFTAARLLGRNMITMIMAARWCNLAACVLLLALAVRRMPFAGAALAVAGLFPRTLQLFASCSYDGIILSGISVYIAWCFALLCGDGFSVADVMILAFSAAHTALCKGGVYLPAVGVIYLVPLMKKGISSQVRRRWRLAARALAAGACVLFMVHHIPTIFAIFARPSGTVTFWTGENTLYTFSDILTGPGRFARILLNTVHVRCDSMIGEMVGYILTHKWWIVYGFVLLVLLGTLDRRGTPVRCTLRGKLLLLLLAGASTGLIFLSMLLSYTASEALYIGGLQGRYFLPLLPLLFPVLENRLVLRERVENVWLVYAAAVLVGITFFQILLGCFAGL
ncbi:MAG: DUF2142 domain-containing protein [Eubacteriales bacterium]|nr:DUF2142 domain-containing protein [Eubacteriales bacterium]